MTVTSANVANAILKLVAADALPALVGGLVIGNLVNRDYEPTLAQAGDTVDVPLGNAQVVLSTHAEAIFQIPDITKVLAVPDLLRLYMAPAVDAIVNKIETDLSQLHCGIAANLPVGFGGSPITEVTLDEAETSLFESGAPSMSPKFLVVSGKDYSALRQRPGFVEYGTPSEAGLRVYSEGPIGKLKGFFIFRSRHIHQNDAAPPETCNLAFCREAIVIAMRRLPQPLPGTGQIAEYAELGNFGMRVTMSYQPNMLSQQFTISILYGCAILRNEFAVVVKS